MFNATKKALNQTCLRASLLCVNTDSGRLWCLQYEDQNRTTDTGWVCWFPQPAEQKTNINFSFTHSQLKKEAADGGGGDGLKQEMTSIPSATHLTIMIKNGKRESDREISACQQKKKSCF